MGKEDSPVKSIELIFLFNLCISMCTSSGRRQHRQEGRQFVTSISTLLPFFFKKRNYTFNIIFAISRVIWINSEREIGEQGLSKDAFFTSQYLTDLPGVDDVLRNWSVVGINTRCPRYIHGFGRVTYDEWPFRWIRHIWKQNFIICNIGPGNSWS